MHRRDLGLRIERTGHVDDVGVLLAEGAHVGDRRHLQHDLEPSVVGLQRLDVVDEGRQRGAQNREVDVVDPVEGDRNGLVLAHEAGVEGHVPAEDEAAEGRAAADAHRQLRLRRPAARTLRLAGGPEGGLGARGKIGHHLWRQGRRQARPGRRQQIDEQFRPGLHGVDPDPLRQRETNAEAVRIGTGDGHIALQVDRDAGDVGADRVGKLDHQHAVGGGDGVFRQEIKIGKGQDHAAVALLARRLDLDGFRRQGRADEREKQQRGDREAACESARCRCADAPSAPLLPAAPNVARPHAPRPTEPHTHYPMPIDTQIWSRG
ncbi:hypothetical protein A6302_03368 [Methylobrevis pamukkalensis]|uniref:Uncharacterized protein n=1 Tax=Methylobrevis pamukkalensis TaxID=1439726 RepID=A0A1E3GZ47_9HYPH|nr:hypothetical protein A6302_03368 [Methylobrevis pamukkalensis]